MNDYLETLAQTYESHRNPKIAAGQEAYMRNQFKFLGIKSPLRKEIQKPFLVKKHLPPKEKLPEIIHILWQKPEREYHYFAIELAEKYLKNLEKKDIQWMEYMVTHHSWWDTVDFISAKLMGAYFKQYPQEIKPKTDEWIASNYLWLQRSAILFQLKYKDTLDTELLSSIIERLLGSKEFFINKAIGWVLREYGKTHPEWVKNYAANTSLEPLSKREALKHLMPIGATCVKNIY